MNESIVLKGIHNKKIKNIFILGQPRTGKSTIAKKLLSYGAFSILAMDEVRHAFYACGIQDIYAKDNKTEVKDTYSTAFLEFIKSYIKSFRHNNPDITLIIEGMEMTVQEVAKEFPGDIIVVLGIDTSDTQVFFDLIRMQERTIGHAWTRNITDDELYECIERSMRFSKENEKDARKLRIMYFSCNGYRTEDYERSIINHILRSMSSDNIGSRSEHMNLMDLYLFLDFTDHFENYNYIKNILKIDYYQIIKVDHRDLLELHELRLRVPILYHVDDLRIFEKQISKIRDLRNTSKDIVIDICGNIEKLGGITK